MHSHAPGSKYEMDQPEKKKKKPEAKTHHASPLNDLFPSRILIKLKLFRKPAGYPSPKCPFSPTQKKFRG